MNLDRNSTPVRLGGRHEAIGSRVNAFLLNGYEKRSAIVFQ